MCKDALWDHLLLELNDQMVQLLQKVKQSAEHVRDNDLVVEYDISIDKMVQSLSSQDMSVKRPKIPYPVLKKAIQIVNQTSKEKVYLHKLIKGSCPSFPEAAHSPAPKSPEYIALIKKLQKKYEDSLYAQMVSNVNIGQRREAERDPFSTYKGQLGVGLDLIVTVFTFFVIFYFFASRIFDESNKMFSLIGGLIGAVLGLFIDGLLVIIRGTRAETLQKKKEKERSQATAAYIGKTATNQKKKMAVNSDRKSVV